MKLKLLSIPAILSMLIFASCGSGSSTSLPEVKTESDSLSYYLGSIFSFGYWQLSQSNPDMLKEKNSAEDFYEGVATVLNMNKTGNVSYNEGLKAGIQILGDLDRLKNDSEVDFNKKVFLAALKNALRSEDAVNYEEMQVSFQMMMERINSRTDAKLTVRGNENLKTYGKNHGMTQLGPEVWSKVIIPGSGSSLKTGQKVNMQITIVDDSGREIMPQTAAEVEIGNTGFDANSPVTGPIETMKMGESAEFATTAKRAFGETMQQFGVKPDQVIIYKVVMSPSKGTSSEQDNQK